MQCHIREHSMITYDENKINNKICNN